MPQKNIIKVEEMEEVNGIDPEMLKVTLLDGSICFVPKYDLRNKDRAHIETKVQNRQLTIERIPKNK